MCTVTYIPTDHQSFVLSSNRDVAPDRSSESLNRNHEHFLYSKDKRAGGTWLAIHDQDRLICVLNGAFEYHKSSPPYRISRGKMVLDYFSFKGPEEFYINYDFKDIEPFTFIAWENGSLAEFRWDGEKPYLKYLDSSRAYIWSSSTLYDSRIKQNRKTWFEDFLKISDQPNLDAIKRFHRTAGTGDPANDLVMNRENRVQTVSISHIVSYVGKFIFDYRDLMTGKSDREVLSKIKATG